MTFFVQVNNRWASENLQKQGIIAGYSWGSGQLVEHYNCDQFPFMLLFKYINIFSWTLSYTHCIREGYEELDYTEAMERLRASHQKEPGAGGTKKINALAIMAMRR